MPPLGVTDTPRISIDRGPAPKPQFSIDRAPAAAPPRGLTTGANPRGVAISAPRQAPTLNDREARTPTSSPAYQKAVLDVFKAQPIKAQQLIVKGAARNPSPEGQLVLNFIRSGEGMPTRGGMAYMARAFPEAFAPTDSPVSTLSGLVRGAGRAALGGVESIPQLLGAKLPGTGGIADYRTLGGAVSSGIGDIGHAASSGLGDVARGADWLRSATQLGSPGVGNVQAEGGLGTALSTVLTHAPLDVARAAIESPSVIPKTIAGLGTQALAAGAGLAELPIKAVQEGPLKAFSQTAQGIANDYSQRYGPLVAGNDQAFINRIKQQGAGAELLDALGAVGGFDATAGRGLASLAKAREAITGDANFLTRARPALRISGNEMRDQALARGALKISAQRAEDAMRRIIHRPENPGEIRPLFEGRGQRVLVSGIQASYRRNMQDALYREVRGARGIQGDFRRLNPWEKKAATLVHEGWVPLRSGDAAAVRALEGRRQQILLDRRNSASLGNHIAPKDMAKVDDVKLIEDLQANVHKWLTPKLAAFIDKQGERAGRIERGDERGLTQSAEARRLRAQGEMLGIEHPDVTAQRAQAGEEIAGRGAPKSLMSFDSELRRARVMKGAGSLADKFANYEETRTGLLQDYIDRIRAERPKEWPEPSYMEHTMRPRENFGAFTQGSGHRAMPGYKQSRFDLWRGGAVYRDPQMMVDSVAKGIKGHYQWPMVDELWRRNGLPAPTSQAIRASLGHDVAPSRLTGYELARAYDHMGIDLRGYRFGNPGRLSEAALTDLGYAKLEKTFGSRAGYEPPELEANSNLAAAMHMPDVAMDGRAVFDALHKGRALQADSPFVKSFGWKAVPTEAFNEIHSGLTPSGLAARLTGKGMGLTAGLILGASPSFVIMNTLAHAMLTAFATRGRLLTDMVKAPLWYHGLSDEEKAIVDAQARGRGHYSVQKLGSTAPGHLRDLWRSFQQSLVGRGLGKLNPVTALWKGEDLQSNAFRRVAYYSVTKQLAFRNIGKELGLANQAMTRFMHAFDLGPKDQMAAVLRNQAWAEEAGRRVVNALGDYARLTHRERTLGRGVLFYPFLRHVTRNLFYVLPLKHPVALALVGALGQLHRQEVQQILGPGTPPWDYGRVFFDKNGKLTSIDFTRALPIGGIPTEAASQGVKGLANVIPPALQPVLDMMEGQTTTGQKVPANAFTLLNEVASLSYPYRLLKDLRFGTTLQNPDSVPYLHERPETRKTAAGQAYLQAKEQALAPLYKTILGGLLGLYPKPDDSAVVAAHAARSSRGAGAGWSISAPTISAPSIGTPSISAPSIGSGWSIGG